MFDKSPLEPVAMNMFVASVCGAFDGQREWHLKLSVDDLLCV